MSGPAGDRRPCQPDNLLPISPGGTNRKSRPRTWGGVMPAELLPILLQGVVLGVGLCLSLGPQSIFVLRQGLRGDQALQVAAICALSDVVMIVAGASGSGALLATFPSVRSLATWGGAALIMACGVL